MSNRSWYWKRIFSCSVNWDVQQYFTVDNTDFANCWVKRRQGHLMQKIERLQKDDLQQMCKLFLPSILGTCLPVTITLPTSLLNWLLFHLKDSQRWKENASGIVFEVPNRARYQAHRGGAEPAELLPLAVNGFNIQQSYVLPTLYLCVLCLSENKQFTLLPWRGGQ